jgi:signal transduction histidine kinase
MDVRKVLDETLALVAYEMEAQGVLLEKEYAPELPPVPMDPEQMKQVFLNLLLNAIQAMDQGGQLKVSAALKNQLPGARSGRFMEISFRDTGKGIPEDMQTRIFEPFFSTKEEGIGLGLPIAQRIIEEHGGKIRLVSHPGEGTIFYLTFPYGTQMNADR